MPWVAHSFPAWTQHPPKIYQCRVVLVTVPTDTWKPLVIILQDKFGQRIMSSSPTKWSPAKATGIRQRARMERMFNRTPTKSHWRSPYSRQSDCFLPHPGFLTCFTPSLRHHNNLITFCRSSPLATISTVHITLLSLETLLSAAPFTARWLGALLLSNNNKLTPNDYQECTVPKSLTVRNISFRELRGVRLDFFYGTRVAEIHNPRRSTHRL